jgi:hypothetical protein
MWFEGGEAVLSEPVGELQKVIHSIESGAEEKSVFAEEVQGESHLEQTNSGPQSQVFLKFQCRLIIPSLHLGFILFLPKKTSSPV